jgi:hypothetical protein
LHGYDFFASKHHEASMNIFLQYIRIFLPVLQEITFVQIFVYEAGLPVHKELMIEEAKPAKSPSIALLAMNGLKMPFMSF